MVDGQDRDTRAFVLELPARAAGGRVPSSDGLDAADVGEPWDITLCLPGVVRLEAVGAVGAGDEIEGAGVEIVAAVI